MSRIPRTLFHRVQIIKAFLLLYILELWSNYHNERIPHRPTHGYYQYLREVNPESNDKQSDTLTVVQHVFNKED